MANHNNDSILLNFYKKIEEKRSDDFKSKKSLGHLHEQLKSNKGHHHAKSSYNFDQQSKYLELNYLFIGYNKGKNAPLRQRDENSNPDGKVLESSSTQRQVCNYIAKHYQIPKKEK